MADPTPKLTEEESQRAFNTDSNFPMANLPEKPKTSTIEEIVATLPTVEQLRALKAKKQIEENRQ